MTTLTRKIGLVVAAAAAVSAVGAQVTAPVAALTVPHRAGVNAEPAKSASPVPDGYVRVVDDTGLISIAVPSGWVTETEPTFDGLPNIETAPGSTPPACDGCGPRFDLPSISVLVSQYEPIEQIDDCEAPNVTPFDNGRFVGNREVGGGCDADIESVEASQVDYEFNVHVTVAYWSVDLEPVIEKPEASQIFDTVLDTLEWTGVPYPAAHLPIAVPADPDDSVWPYPTFDDVPQLGTEPVRGTGCGSEGQLGAVVPDGLWSGYVRDFDPATNTYGIDVACVYYGESAQAMLAGGTATIVDDDPNFLVVNNSTRVRRMPSTATIEVLGELGNDGRCYEGAHLPGGPTVDGVAYNSNTLAWVRIDGGAVTWTFTGCDFVPESS